MTTAPRWGLSPLDWHAPAIDELADHPIGVYVARCGHRLMMVTTSVRKPTEPDLPELRPVGGDVNTGDGAPAADNRHRVIHATCTLHRGPAEFVNLVVRKLFDGTD